MRLLEIIISNQDSDKIEKIINEDNVIEHWSYQSEKDQIVLKILAKDEYAKEILSNWRINPDCG